MGTISDKLNLLRTTKNNIRSALNSKGLDIYQTLPFSAYAAAISSLKVLSQLTNIQVTGHADMSGVASGSISMYQRQIVKNQDGSISIILDISGGGNAFNTGFVGCDGQFTIDLY